MNRVYHHYLLLEETNAGMWIMPSGQELKRLNKLALDHMKNIKRFSASMLRVIREWKHSSEHNLSNIGSNRIAWLGQAAVCIATGAPESSTRVGWYFLNDKQRQKANESAQIAIEKWEAIYTGNMKQLELGI